MEIDGETDGYFSCWLIGRGMHPSLLPRSILLVLALMIAGCSKPRNFGEETPPTKDRTGKSGEEVVVAGSVVPGSVDGGSANPLAQALKQLISVDAQPEDKQALDAIKTIIDAGASLVTLAMDEDRVKADLRLKQQKKLDGDLAVIREQIATGKFELARLGLTGIHWSGVNSRADFEDNKLASDYDLRRTELLSALEAMEAQGKKGK